MRYTESTFRPCPICRPNGDEASELTPISIQVRRNAKPDRGPPSRRIHRMLSIAANTANINPVGARMPAQLGLAHPSRLKERKMDQIISRGQLEAISPAELDEIRGAHVGWFEYAHKRLTMSHANAILAATTPHAVRFEQARALGFASVNEMDQHADWVAGNARRHAAALAHQGSSEARARRDSSGALDDTFVVPLSKGRAEPTSR